MFRPEVTSRRGEHHVIFHKWLDDDIPAKCGAFYERDIDAMGCEGFKNLIGITTHCRQLDPGIFSEKSGHQSRQEILTNRLGSANGQPSGVSPALLRDGLFGLLSEFFQFDGVAEENLANGSQRHSPACAVKQRQTHLFLQRLDLLGDRRLGDEEFFRRASEVQVMSHGAKDFESKVLHVLRSYSQLALTRSLRFGLPPQLG